MHRLFGRRSDENGATALEFAIVLPVLILLLLGLIEFLLISFSSSVIDGATRDASRFGITGNGGSNREQSITNLLKQRMGPVLFDPSKLTISIRSFDYKDIGSVGNAEPFTDGSNGQPANGTYDPGESFTDTNNNGIWDSQAGTPGAGTPGQLVQYTVTYKWVYITPIWRLLKPTGQKDVDDFVNISSTILVRNEP